MHTSIRSLWTIIVGTVVTAPIAAHAQDEDQFREQAKAAGAQLRHAGEPMDRCSLGAFLADGAVVVRVVGSSPLKPGDRLAMLNHVNTAGKRSEDVVAVLRGISPSAVVPITLDRQGELLDLDVTCGNARQVSEALLKVLDLAGKGKFDDCVDALGSLSELGTYGASLKAQCAALARKARKYDVPALSAHALQMGIEDARWASTTRADLVQELRTAERSITQALGQARFEQLVAATRTWPGGERMYEASEPDWALFRRNSEAALRARLIDPASAQIEWPYGFLLGSWRPLFSKRIQGYWTCGTVNARNRMGGYTGRTSFVVVLDQSASVLYSDVGEAKDIDVLTSQCNGSVKLLPPPPAALSGLVATQPTANTSIADEIKKLLDLKNSGALTEAEFQAAKAHLLEGGH